MLRNPTKFSLYVSTQIPRWVCELRLSLADRNNQVLGPFGVNYVNDAGRALFDLLDSKGICSAATFFEKPVYATWRNPRSKKGHQLYHVLIPSKDLSRISDAGVSKLTVESDHDPLQISPFKFCKETSRVV